MSQFAITTFEKSQYRSKEDTTTLPPDILVYGSQNVLINSANRIANRKGYTLDGASQAGSGVASEFVFQTIKGYERPLRSGGLVASINGKLQWRYVAQSGDILNTVPLVAGFPYWVDLVTGLTSVGYNYTTFYDQTEKLRYVLFVNGASEITEWNFIICSIEVYPNKSLWCGWQCICTCSCSCCSCRVHAKCIISSSIII